MTFAFGPQLLLLVTLVVVCPLHSAQESALCQSHVTRRGFCVARSPPSPLGLWVSRVGVGSVGPAFW